MGGGARRPEEGAGDGRMEKGLGGGGRRLLWEEGLGDQKKGLEMGGGARRWREGLEMKRGVKRSMGWAQEGWMDIYRRIVMSFFLLA